MERTSKRLAGLTTLATSPTVELPRRSGVPTVELASSPPVAGSTRRRTRTSPAGGKLPRPGEYRMTRPKAGKAAAIRLVSVAHGQVELVVNGQPLALDVQDARALAALIQHTLG